MRPFRTFLTLALIAAAIPSGPARAMSSDSSGYAVVLPFLFSTSSFVSRIFVENHSSAAVSLVAYYVGESTATNAGRFTCSDASANPVPQTFGLTVGPDSVLSFDLRSLIDEKCKGSLPSSPTSFDRGTLTLFAQKASDPRISASARVERAAGAGVAAFGFSEAAVPLGGLEGTTQIVAGVRSGAIGSQTLRTDCLVGSLADASASGNLYRLTVKDHTGGAIGSTVFALKPWSAEMFTDVLALVGAPGLVIDGATVEIEPAANPTNPPMISSCRVVEISNAPVLATVLSVGKVYEPRDLLRHRSAMQIGQTPGWGAFTFDASKGRSLHVAFLRHPDLVQCSVSDPTLAIVVTSPDGHFVAGGFQSTGEFFTGFRRAVNGGDAGAWGIEVIANPGNPPSGPVPYTLSCVSGNGMSQMDRVSP
jgi:hypothetical protein